MDLGKPETLGRGFSVTANETTPGAPSQAVALDLYRLAVEMADRVSDRRATANQFFFTVQAGLAVALGAFSITDEAAHPDKFLLGLAAMAGVLIAGSWWLLLRSYRDLNTAKFVVINRIERDHLPLHVFSDEWDELKKDPIKQWRPWYAEQGQVERAVPLIYLMLYIAVGVYVVVS